MWFYLEWFVLLAGCFFWGIVVQDVPNAMVIGAVWGFSVGVFFSRNIHVV